ncbi:class I SAM-dependent methyltransferase [Tahibacter amnicola]|uniref:Class I SAM-dependent methyltransferase n=1 Tax=Tahibacter amnicola TaxID=2976241 RepID=A0ABY6BJ01_9GAMM|nr:class I SAM-dependent methyltransferase [Tahibacter amnicola]UXI69854.1 class I SAM-dependent methyltransferase [Tahibacter amnicola]
MSRLESLRGEWRVLRQLARGMPDGASQAQRLEAFYGPQAERYDRFRERLLHGRSALIESLAVPSGAHVVELGGGTGRNLEFFGPRIRAFRQVDVVDLCPSLVAKARHRLTGIPTARVHLADATTWQPDAPVDAVYFSYALSMIPNATAALDNALAMLRPGGLLGVVDFHVPAHSGRRRWLARHFWRPWFRHDGVRLDDTLLPQLQTRLCEPVTHDLDATVPYIPLLRVPYFRCVGRKRRHD